MPKTALTGLLLLIALLAAASPAAASRGQESIFQDDASLLYSSAERRDRTLDEMDRLGTDTIHSLVLWNWVAPDPQSSERPSFDASNPAAYPARRWDRFDDLVRGTNARGLDVLLTPTGPIPHWAARCAPRRGTCLPNIREFQRFVIALGKRYSGTYRDENQGGGVLPRVDRWSVWNEPNQGGWLTPQWKKRRGKWIPVAGYHYRRLFSAAVRGLRANGHERSQVLLGETAPLGRETGKRYKRSLSPMRFYRAVFCINKRGRPVKGRYKRYLRCRGYDELDADGVAHHPYTRGAGAHPRSGVEKGDVTVRKVGRLMRVLNRAARRDRIRHGRPIYFTEYGFQTNPPDRHAGVSQTRQARWLNQSSWMTWNRKRVKSVAQYELFDEPDLGAFQTGLRFKDGDAKKALRAYRIPLWVVNRGRYRLIWGQVRPGQKGDPVEIQYKTRKGRKWRHLKNAEVENSAGYLTVKTRKRSKYWRILWNGEKSRRAKVRKR